MAVKYSVAARNSELNGLTTAVGNAGILVIVSGTRPANVAAALTGTVLATITMGSPWAPAAAAGVLSPTVPQSDLLADNTGTATHFRQFQSDGTTAVIDGDVSTSGADMNLTSTSIIANGVVSITSFAITAGNA